MIERKIDLDFTSNYAGRKRHNLISHLTLRKFNHLIYKKEDHLCPTENTVDKKRIPPLSYYHLLYIPGLVCHEDESERETPTGTLICIIPIIFP